MKQVSIWGAQYLRAWIRSLRHRPSNPRLAAAPEPAKNTGHILLVKAADTDVASAVRTIAGVRKVTRGAGGIWNVAADLDITGAVARRIVQNGGSLKLLVNVKPGLEGAFISCVAKYEA